MSVSEFEIPGVLFTLERDGGGGGGGGRGGCGGCLLRPSVCVDCS